MSRNAGPSGTSAFVNPKRRRPPSPAAQTARDGIPRDHQGREILADFGRGYTLTRSRDRLGYVLSHTNRGMSFNSDPFDMEIAIGLRDALNDLIVNDDLPLRARDEES